MKDGALIETLTFRGISERFQKILVRLELGKSFFSTHLKDDNHESSHKEASISQFLWVAAAVVEDFAVFVLGILKEKKVN